jgi:predicted ATP-dependent serine protease
VSAEESKEQIKARAVRLQLANLAKMRIYPMGASSDLGAVMQARKPAAVMVDSLPGLTPNLEDAVELCKRFKEYAVDLNVPVIFIDHVTKDREFAGLMALQHEVDTTLLFTVIDDVRRELAGVKNRFGPIRRVELDMTERGLMLGLPDVDEDEDEGGEDVED